MDPKTIDATLALMKPDEVDELLRLARLVYLNQAQ